MCSTSHSRSKTKLKMWNGAYDVAGKPARGTSLGLDSTDQLREVNRAESLVDCQARTALALASAMTSVDERTRMARVVQVVD
jgi:hypothetical protein